MIIPRAISVTASMIFTLLIKCVCLSIIINADTVPHVYFWIDKTEHEKALSGTDSKDGFVIYGGADSLGNIVSWTNVSDVFK